ncbi:5-hydroxytryptamine receptor 1-like isoform X1 [Centruroides sculpturatus]|uniref:5-hydroxytryptamine receptor 1-like isoform X1 n=2 Tax=Centruroides sculpturatus TaxID=218467 RepID=UPI000C6E974A|nr:5-hydroxytryptamine receptor 1-like isoform X1 [Centruroides sculpturatus]
MGRIPIRYVMENYTDIYCNSTCLDEDVIVMEEDYSTCATIVISVVLGTIIVFTTIGNSLVCASVFCVKKLRRPPNFLLVSLAVSDLCVALLVMPLALHYELSGDWRLGDTICDMWIAFDMTCCTASILNLCMISIDRYLAITKPLTYGVRTRARRTWISIAATWMMSCLVSIPPLLILGNDHGSELMPSCEINQNFAYQLYATFGAFYIPLLVMVVMYCKIYVAAKRVVEAEKGTLRKQTGLLSVCWNSSIDRKEMLLELKNRSQLNLCPLPDSNESVMFRTPERYQLCTVNMDENGGRTSNVLWKKKNKATRRAIILKERKASITLGIIVTAFTVCWLPFFVVALMRSLLKPTISVPRFIRSFVLWLGYANSMLNPIIYMTFHQDFRRSFKEILLFRCSTVNKRFREQAYRSQYGDPIYRLGYSFRQQGIAPSVP